MDSPKFFSANISNHNFAKKILPPKFYSIRYMGHMMLHVTSKASFLNLSNNGTTYPMTVLASTHLNILTELFSQCLIKTYVAITYQVDI